MPYSSRQSSLMSQKFPSDVPKVPYARHKSSLSHKSSLFSSQKFSIYVTKVPFPLALSLSLFRFLPAYLLPFLLFNFLIIQTTLKLVLFTVHLHLHFLFHGSGKFQTVAATVRVTGRILPEKRSKYSVVGTKTKKNS